MNAGEIIGSARAEGRTTLTEADGKALLAEFGIAVPRSVIASSRHKGGRAHAAPRGQDRLT
jgi:acyl-CoA synthetase (NDP forming)